MKTLQQFIREDLEDKSQFISEQFETFRDESDDWLKAHPDELADWLFEMSNETQGDTGLPMNIWIDSPGDDSRGHDEKRLKFQLDKSPNHKKDFIGSMLIIPEPKIPASQKNLDLSHLTSKDLDDLRRWIQGNYTILCLFWDKYFTHHQVTGILRPITEITDEIIKKELSYNPKKISKDEKSKLAQYYLSQKHRNLPPKNLDELMDMVYTAIDEKGPNCDLNHIDTSNIKDMSGLFDGVEFTGDISGWDVSNVKNMTSMFQGCPFNGDISGWDVSNVIYATFMFAKSKFKQDISKWNFKKLKSSYGMFENCKIKDSYKPKID